MGNKWHRYTDEELEEAVASSKSLVETLRRLGYTKIAGGNSCNLRDKLIRKGIDFSHFTGSNHRKGKPARNKLPANEILIFEKRDTRPKAYVLRRALLEIGREYRCEECGIGNTWNGKPITLHIDHKNGDWSDNRQENLRFLCPNCHQQTPNYGNKRTMGG